MKTNAFIPLLSFLVILFSSSHAFSKEEITTNKNNSNNPSTLSNERKESLIHLLKQDCGSCHGMTLKGGLGPPLLPENLQNKPTAFISTTILLGRPGTAMPPWANILTKEEAQWLSLQLKTGISGNITHTK